MTSVRIGEVVTSVDTWNPQSAPSAPPFRYIDISSIDQVAKSIARPSTVAVVDAPSRARQLVRRGDVLVSTVRPNLNAVAIVGAEFDGATASTGFTVLRPIPSRLDGRFLYRWVQTPAFVNSLIARATGASYPAVSDRIVRETSIPLPPIEEQRRIAAMLDKADAVRRKRREGLRLLDDFLRSVFLEMFGDPVGNEKGLGQRALGDVATVERGKFTPRPRDDPRFYGGAYPFIQTGDISRSGGVLRAWTQTLNVQGTAVSRSFPAGTIAMSIAANIADTTIVDFDFYCPDSVVGIVPNAALLNVEYLEGCLRLLKPSIVARAPMTAQRNINLQVLRPLQIPVPPRALQERYAVVLRKGWELTSRLERATKSADTLASSLASRAFERTT